MVWWRVALAVCGWVWTGGWCTPRRWEGKGASCGAAGRVCGAKRRGRGAHLCMLTPQERQAGAGFGLGHDMTCAGPHHPWPPSGTCTCECTSTNKLGTCITCPWKPHVHARGARACAHEPRTSSCVRRPACAPLRCWTTT